MGMTAYYCVKRYTKAAIKNIVVLSLFIFVKLMEVYYINIRTTIYEIVGEEMFDVLRSVISAVLFFGTSVTIGVQFFCNFLGLFMLLFLAAKAAVKFLKKCSKKVFTSLVIPENEKAKDKHGEICKNYLVLERLLN